MGGVLEYKCPSCGGAIQFDSASQKMKCPYCSTEYDVETLRAYDEELKQEKPEHMEWSQPEGSQWEQGEQEHIAVYSCSSCGGEIVGDESMAATSCPFCDNPVIIPRQFAGDLRPDWVIPFKLDKAAAKQAMIGHLQGKRLLPKIFQNENHIDEIRGIYVPFWLFDAKADADLHYRATRVRHWSDSQYNYTETSYFHVTREGDMEFEMVPADGTTKLPDDLMESIEPYEYREAVDFQTAYLSGYLANKYDVPALDSADRANKRIISSTERTFASTIVGFSSVTPINHNIRLRDGKVQYALLPVWILNTSWNGKKYIFAMNGQTGKFVGNLPVNWKAFWGWFAGLTAAFGCVATALSFLFI